MKFLKYITIIILALLLFSCTSASFKNSKSNSVENNNKSLITIEDLLLDDIPIKMEIVELSKDNIYEKCDKTYAEVVTSYNNGDLKMVKIPFEKIKEQNFDYNTFVQYNLNVIDDTAANPNIEFDKDEKCSVKKLTLVEAIDEIETIKGSFLPFFNVESQYFNVIHKQGSDYEIMVPAF